MEYLVVRDINIISVKLRCYIQHSVWLPLSEAWGASCPGWFILPPAKDLGRTVSSVHSYCTIILEYLVVRDINIISVKLRCLYPTFSLVTLVRGVGGKQNILKFWAGGKTNRRGQLAPHPLSKRNQLNVWSKHLRLIEIMFISLSTKYSCSRWCNKIWGLSILSEILGGGQDKLPWTACPPPRQYITQLNVWSKHLRLTEIKFISLSTKYSCSRWCNKICRLSILTGILGRAKINRPGQLAPHPLSICNPTERLK